MMRRFAKFGGISTLALVFLMLFSVVDIGSKARAAEFTKAGEARVTGRTWVELMVLTAPLAAAVGVTLADYRPTGLLHTSWLSGNLVVYPGGLWAGIEYYVDGGKTGASDGNPGTSWEKPLLTIQAGIDKIVGGQGDRVYIAPKSTAYAEALTVNKDYAALIGIWSARYGYPDIAPASGVAITNNTGQGLVLERLRCVGAGGSNDGVLQRANGFRFSDCVFEGAGDALELRAGNTDANDAYTASEGVIERCWLRDSAQGLRFMNPGIGVGAIGGVGPTGVTVKDCTFVNNTNQDILDEDTAGSNDRTFFDCEVFNCRFLTRNKAVYITLTNGGGNRGLVHGFFADDAGLNATKIALATGIVFAGQQAAGIVDGSGF